MSRTPDGLPKLMPTLAVYGALVYLLVWASCVLLLFGYEEQWVGPDEAFYTVGSMTWTEVAAYVVCRYVLTFPAWPPAWFGEFSARLVAAPVSGAALGGMAGWLLDRRPRASGSRPQPPRVGG